MTSDSHLSSRSQAPGRCRRRRAPLFALFVALILAGFGSACRRQGAGSESDTTSLEPVPARGRLVALIVLDTVRRDYVEPCGDKRPITPNLAKLARSGTTYCGMVAPGSWTLPVHASLFTGRLPVEHGADLYAEGIPTPDFEEALIRPLDRRFKTLAERFSAAGYQTMLVSGNPVLHPATGLSRGFHFVSVSQFAEGDEALVAPKLRELMQHSDLDPKSPLFLMVNVIIAHGPYEAVPRGVPWLTSTPDGIELTNHVRGRTLIDLLLHDQLGPRMPSFLDELHRNYAWGVYRADQDLGSVLSYLQTSGWLRRDSLIAVTSDHGERLGERNRFGHGASVAPEVTHVFAVVRGPGFDAGRQVESLNQSQDLFPTLLQAAGLQPEPGLQDAFPLTAVNEQRVAITTSEPDAHRVQATGGVEGMDRLVALETPDGRLEWSSTTGFDANHSTGKVTGELKRLALRIAATTKQTMDQQRPEPMPPDLEKQLKALGYVN